MKHESSAYLQPESLRHTPPERLRPWLITAGLVAALVVWLLVWYGDTTTAMVSTWSRSATFTHGYIIAPISLYLIWLRRHELAALDPSPGLLGIIALIPLGGAWLLASLAEVQVLSQYALIAMISAVVYGVLGRRVTWTIAFPLAFLFLAVPSGAVLTEWLMNYTADFTVAMLKLSGIPVYREGNYFSIPSGEWSVVEACSGLRYLIASVTGGCLFAYLYFRSYWKRVAMIAASVIIPIIANGIRAYMIVMIGHLSNMKLAVGVDHLIYGWVFFGFVMFLLFWVASRWSEGEVSAPAPSGAAATAAPTPAPIRGYMVVASAAIVVLAGIWPLYAAHLVNKTRAAAPIVLDLPALAGAWSTTHRELTTWRPWYPGADQTLSQTYESPAGPVFLHMSRYNSQRSGAKLISSSNLITSDHDDLLLTGTSFRKELAGSLPLRESRLRTGDSRLLVWSWYEIDGRPLISPYLGNALLAKTALVAGRATGTAVFIATPYLDNPQAARNLLTQFARDLRSAPPVSAATSEPK